MSIDLREPPSRQRARPSSPSRRAFLRRSALLSWAAVAGGFSTASLGFLWPNLRGGFGAVLDVGPADVILEGIRANRRPFEYTPGRAYIIEYDPALDPGGTYAELTGGHAFMALYWRCVHLGCKVPWCQTSQWFECPCHGSQYNRWGEWRDGPAPRGLDRFPSWVEDGRLFVDTSSIVTGTPRQAPVLLQPAEGAHCVDL